MQAYISLCVSGKSCAGLNIDHRVRLFQRHLRNGRDGKRAVSPVATPIYTNGKPDKFTTMPGAIQDGPQPKIESLAGCEVTEKGCSELPG